MRWRTRAARWTAAAAALSAGALSAGGAAAGAWTRPLGETFVSLATGYYATDGGGYEETTATLYAEYGWREAWTLGGAVELKQPVGAASDEDRQISLAAFARARLWVGEHGDPVSVQFGAILPLEDFTAATPSQNRRERDLDVRLQYGRGFATGWGDAFVDAQGGVRWRLEDAADEVRLDLTAGLRPAPRWLLLAQSFNTIGLRNATGEGADFDAYKLAPSIGYEIAPGLTLLLGVEREVAGRNIDRGYRLRAAAWTAF